MMNRIRTIVLLLIFLANLHVEAQEFQCSVQVVSQSVQGSNKKVFESLQKSLNEFMNNQKWTDDLFSPEERIECNMMINVTEALSIDEFRGSISIQARRPVYNSTYNSVLFNYIDQDMQFKYVEGEPIIYNPNTFDSNLIAVIAYYSYVVLGIDYDSYSLYGGTSFFQQAEQIVNRAQSATQTGWKSFESQRNRYWLVENALNQYHKPLRQCYYEYHRLGLDTMSDKPEAARAAVLTSLEQIKKVHRQKPSSFYTQLFFTAKADEIVKIFEESFSMEKGKLIELLGEVDPANQKKYNVLTEANK